jgi:hypothetical protein
MAVEQLNSRRIDAHCEEWSSENTTQRLLTIGPHCHARDEAIGHVSEEGQMQSKRQPWGRYRRPTGEGRTFLKTCVFSALDAVVVYVT